MVETRDCVQFPWAKNINSDDDEDAYGHGDAKLSREMESVRVRQSRRQVGEEKEKMFVYRNVCINTTSVGLGNSDISLTFFASLFHVVSSKNAEYSIGTRSHKYQLHAFTLQSKKFRSYFSCYLFWFAG